MHTPEWDEVPFFICVYECWFLLPFQAEVGDEVTKGEEEKVIQDLSKLSRQEKLTVSYHSYFNVRVVISHLIRIIEEMKSRSSQDLNL